MFKAGFLFQSTCINTRCIRNTIACVSNTSRINARILKQKSSLKHQSFLRLFNYHSNCLAEAVTEAVTEKRSSIQFFLKISWNTWNYMRKSSPFSDSAGWSPITLLKKNSIIGIFKDFTLISNYHTPIAKILWKIPKFHAAVRFVVFIYR